MSPQAGRRPHVVVLTSFLPWPLASGGQVRQFHLLDAARRRARISLVVDHVGWGTPQQRAELAERWPDVSLWPGPHDPHATSDGDAAPGAASGAAVREVAGLRLRLRRLRARLDPDRSKLRTWRHPEVERALARALQDSPDLLQVEFVQTARYLPAVTPCPVLLVAHDVVSRRDRRARRVRGVARHVEVGDWRARRHERAALHRADAVVVTSTEDLAAARRLGAVQASIVPNGASDRLLDIAAGGAATRLVFVASAGHEPNLDAVSWWSEAVVPVADGLPPLCVVGAGWEAHAPQRGVEFLGYVDDLAEVLQSAVVVAPLRVGGGTKVKMVEAMVAGRPIAATPVAVEGLPVRDGVEALVTETPAVLAAAVRRLLDDAELRQRLGTAARAAARDLVWSRVAARMDAVYDGLLR
jgi:polysaccharide biosynthesis protein PslH